MHNQAYRPRARTWVLGLILITGCSEGADPTGPEVTAVWDGVVASVTVSPAQLTIGSGDNMTLTATVRDAAGNVLTGGEVTWTTSNNSCVGVHGLTGELTVKGPPGAIITARADGITGTASITVIGPHL